MNAHDLEEVARHEGDVGARGLGEARDARDHAGVLRHRLEGVILVAEIDEVRIGEAGIAAAMVHFPDCHQAIWLRIRQRPQQHAVHDAEDGGRRADAQRQRQDHGGAESEALPQPASRVSQVLQCGFEHAFSGLEPRYAVGYLDGRRPLGVASAELPEARCSMR